MSQSVQSLQIYLRRRSGKKLRPAPIAEIALGYGTFWVLEQGFFIIFSNGLNGQI